MANKKLSAEERTVDVLERIGLAVLYLGTNLSQKKAAKILGMDNERARLLLEGVDKPSKYGKEEE